jgi:hypothetical protein
VNQEHRQFRMLNITVNPAQPIWPKRALEIQLDRAAHDWIRYAENAWLVWSDKSAEEWQRFFKDHVPVLKYHQYIILGVDLTQRQGWMPKEIWDWISKYNRLEHLNRDALLKLLGGIVDAPKAKDDNDPLAQILGLKRSDVP